MTAQRSILKLLPKRTVSHRLTITVSVLSAVVCLTAMAGCQSADPNQGYTSKDLFPSQYKTVFVEMFESRTFRRQIEFEFTRALCQQLELHSPYKIVSDRRKADTILFGEIRNVTESVLSRQRELDRPIQNELTMTIVVTWKDLRNGDLIMDNQMFRVSAQYAVMLGAGTKSAEKKAANNAARRVVEAMESPW